MPKSKISKSERAYIVVTPIDGMNAVEAHLVHLDGRVLASAVTRAPFYAYEDVWLKFDNLRRQYETLKVDPHAYTVDQFIELHQDVWDRCVALGYVGAI